MRVCIYIRVSSEEQVAGTSLESQERLCRQFAASAGHEVVQVFADRGESAKSADRPAFQDMVKFCIKRRAVDAVLVWKLDRFARNHYDYAVYENALSNVGTRILSVTETNDASSHGKAMRVITAAIAQLDNEVRAERAKESMKQLARSGFWVHAAPLGYAAARDEAGRPILVPDQERAEPVRSCFEAVGDGSSIARAIEIIHASGVRTARGAAVTGRAMHELLRKKVYAGIIQSSLTGGREVEAAFPGLISRDLFDRVQLVLEGRGVIHKAHERTSPDYPLRGFVRCGCCGKKLTASTSRGRSRRYAYYHCHDQACRSVRIPASDLHDQFIALLKSQNELSCGKMKLLKFHIRRMWEYKKAEARAEAERIRAKIDSIEQKRSVLLDKLIEGVITDEVFRDKDGGLVLDAAELKTRSHSNELDALNVESAILFAERIAKDAAEIWNRLTPDKRERFQHTLFPAGFLCTQNGELRTAATVTTLNDLHNAMTRKNSVAPQSVLTWNQTACWILAMNRAERIAA